MKTTINGRSIIVTEYSTERNWSESLPNCNWLCILINNQKPKRYFEEVISKILSKDVCYVCCSGQESEKLHDSVDEEIGYREVDSDNLYLPTHFIMTTWEDNIEEGIWFGLFAAHHESIEIMEVAIIDMTDGVERERIHKTLQDLEKRSDS